MQALYEEESRDDRSDAKETWMQRLRATLAKFVSNAFPSAIAARDRAHEHRRYVNRVQHTVRVLRLFLIHRDRSSPPGRTVSQLAIGDSDPMGPLDTLFPPYRL